MKHRNQFYAITVALVLLAGLFAGCAPKTATPVVTQVPAAATANPVPTTALTVTDTLGRTVAFDKMPERIVVAGKATALMVNTLYMFPDAATKIVAIENRSQSPDAFISLIDPSYTDKLTLEKNAGPEAIAPAQPDVVILKSSVKEKLGDPLEAIGIKVVYLDLETPESFYKDLQTIGALLGNIERADEITAFYQGKVGQVTEAIKDLKEEDKIKVLLLQHSIEDNVTSFGVPPANWLQTIIVETAGGIPVWKEAVTGDGWQTVTLDQIAAWNPYGIGIIDYDGGALDTLAEIQSDPTWQALEAVKEHRLVAFPMDYLSWDQPDPRWILGLQWLAFNMYPESFPVFDLNAEVTGFYQTLFGMDEATITSTVLPLLKGTLVIERDVDK